MDWIILLLQLGISVLIIASMWKLYEKAGKPGWAAIVPIYNLIVLLEIVGKPVWWIVLFLIPFVNFLVIIYVFILLAKSFGKGTGFGILMFILPFIFIPMLAFGDSQYQGHPKS